ncbi:hypothetical protein [Halorhabdus sp. CUG00001]|uniref:hypothetical protein n=1 Tax=Halorhabdus sp. CUG00001 TaxID=2600297 RepID=UPI00131E4F10|nr:hypothetical protein [Halorhabdus sp. CUG00001]
MFSDLLGFAQRLLLATVVVTLVFAGPVVPNFSFTGERNPTLVGDGNATVSGLTVEADDFRFADGRFGTAVTYLRAPEASLYVDQVTGQPRIVYRLRVPKLDVDRAGTQMLSRSGGVRIRMDDRAFPPEVLTQPRYDGLVTVRVQSHTVDRTVFNESIELEVDR